MEGPILTKKLCILSRYESFSDASTVKTHLDSAGFEIHLRAVDSGTEPLWNTSGDVLLLLPESELVRARTVLRTIEDNYLESDSVVMDPGELLEYVDCLAGDDDVDLVMDRDKWLERYWLLSMLVRIVRNVY